MYIPNKKQYNELTSAEKILVGYIYDLYFKWLTERNSPVFLKHSMFSDFVQMMSFEDDLKYYADYLYLCEYKDEKSVKVDEYKLVVPKSSITLANNTITEELKPFHSRIEDKKKSFFQKLFNK